METVPSKEGEAEDAAYLLRRETRELAEQVSKQLQLQVHEELQGFLKQLRTTLSTHLHGHGVHREPEPDESGVADDLRTSAFSMRASYPEPLFQDSAAGNGEATVGKKAPNESGDMDNALHDWMFHNRRGYMAQRELENAKLDEDPLLGIGANEDGMPGTSMDGMKMKVKKYFHNNGSTEKAAPTTPGMVSDTTQEHEKPNKASEEEAVASQAWQARSSSASTKTGQQGDMPNGVDARHDGCESQYQVSRDSKIFYHTTKSKKMRRINSKNLTSAKLMDGPRAKAARIVSSLLFDAILGITIIVNAVLIGVQADWNVKNRGEEVPTVFRVFDIIFCIIFVVELVIRLFVYRLKFYCMRGWGWNWFDTFVVIAQVMEETMMLFAASSFRNLSFMRIMRIFRLIRIIRLVRILRIIGELRLLVLSIAHSLKSLGWTIVLILLMMYINAIWLTQVVADETDQPEDALIFYFYGSLLTSILSLFQSITGGLDWDNAMRPLVDEINPVWGLVYCMYIAFSVFAMLNVVTGVFVESALQSANEDKDIIMVNTMGDFFKKASGNRGTMSWSDFQSNLHTQHMKDYFKLIDIDVSEARAIFRLLDLNQSGSISVDEFLSGCVRLRGSAKAIDMAMLMHEVRRIETMLKQLQQLQTIQLASRTVERDPSKGRPDAASMALLESCMEVAPRLEVQLRHTATDNAAEQADLLS